MQSSNDANAEEFIAFRPDIPRRSGVRSPDKSAGVKRSSTKKRNASEFVM